MELFKDLKDLMTERKKAFKRGDWESCNKLKQNDSRLKRELRRLWCDSPTGLIKCPACHGGGSFGSYWDGDYSDCSYCFGLGFVDQKTRMKYVKSFIGIEKELRNYICAERREASL